jgi:hypothetical protein
MLQKVGTHFTVDADVRSGKTAAEREQPMTLSNSPHDPARLRFPASGAGNGRTPANGRKDQWGNIINGLNLAAGWTGQNCLTTAADNGGRRKMARRRLAQYGSMKMPRPP